MKRIATNIPVYLLLLLTVAGVIFWWKTSNFPGQIQDLFKGKYLAETQFTVTNKSGTKTTPEGESITYQTFVSVPNEKYF